VLNDTNYGTGARQAVEKAVTEPEVVLILTSVYVQQFESEQLNMGYSTIMEDDEPIIKFVDWKLEKSDYIYDSSKSQTVMLINRSF